MSTQGRQFSEGDVRRSTVSDLDLNSPPPFENMIPDCFILNVSSQGLPADLRRGSPWQLRNSVEVIDDEIAIIDRSTFTEAKNNARRNHSQLPDGLRDVLGDAGYLINSISELTERSTWFIKPGGNAPDEEDKNKSPVKNDSEPQVVPQNPLPVMEPPEFSCPICISPLNVPTTTRCGHIFCKECIEKAIATQSKCPTCRKKLGKRGTFRVYLPALN